MVICEASLEQFLQTPGVILDVRSPGEYIQGRIPGAFSFPLFDNAERAQVGTVYKQQGKDLAVELGLRIIGPKLADLVVNAKKILNESPGACAKIHCWRGGMRSSSTAWLLATAGLQTMILKGGYKTFRRHVLQTIDECSSSLHYYPLVILGGLTGSGKTAILHQLREQGEQVLDLENLASHRGSTYGMLGMPPQPSAEQFENEIAMQLSTMDPQRPIWVEDESRMIGSCKIPDLFFKKIRQSPLLLMQRPFKERINHLMADYGNVGKQALIDATLRISKRLGGLQTRKIIELLNEEKTVWAAEQMLIYYDLAYQKGLSSRQQPIYPVIQDHFSTQEWAQLLKQYQLKIDERKN